MVNIESHDCIEQVTQSAAPQGFFESMGLEPRPVYVSRTGHVFAPMCDVLHPGDLAYWWDHPGMLLLLQDVVMPSPGSPCTMTIYIGETRLKAYQAAACFHRDMGQLMHHVAIGQTAVAYWSWKVSHQAWGFQLAHISHNDTTLLRKVHC